MPIPDFQTLMLPLLKLASDGKTRSQSETVQQLAKEFKLTEEDLNELLPSGRQCTFDNRIAWAKVHMKKAGLLEYPKRAYFQITPLGKKVLEKKPEKVGVSFLKQFPDYLEFIKDNRRDGERPVKSVAEDIFEESATHLVIDLLVKMGYGGSRKEAGKHLGKSGDGGIDGIIQEDKLGLDMIYIQAKCWNADKVISRPEIDKFIGALARKGAKKGVFITTSSFARGVRESESKSDMKIVLIDGNELADLMIDYNVGVSISNTYEIKRVDSDYFGDE